MILEKCFVFYLSDLVGGHPILCSKHILEIMFNEPQLLIVFRVALEIEMVYANTREDLADDVVDMAQEVADSPDDPYNYDPYDEGIYLMLTCNEIEWLKY